MEQPLGQGLNCSASDCYFANRAISRVHTTGTNLSTMGLNPQVSTRLRGLQHAVLSVPLPPLVWSSAHLSALTNDVVLIRRGIR
eukprot:COSAG06_NODE_1684_length_8722_cov_3.925896_7_plen_84_part_00